MQPECNFLFFPCNWHTTRYNLACNRHTTQYNIPGPRGPKRFFPHYVSRTTRYNYLSFQKMSNPCGALSRKGLLYSVSRGTSSKRHLYQTEPSAAQPPRSEAKNPPPARLQRRPRRTYFAGHSLLGLPLQGSGHVLQILDDGQVLGTLALALAAAHTGRGQALAPPPR